MLSDPEKRREYDAEQQMLRMGGGYGYAGTGGGGGGGARGGQGFGDFGDIFSMFGGGGGGRRGGQARSGPRRGGGWQGLRRPRQISSREERAVQRRRERGYNYT